MTPAISLAVLVTHLPRAVRSTTYFALRGAAAATTSLGVAGLLLTTACYTYEVRAPAEVPAGRAVVVLLSSSGRTSLGPKLGPDVTRVEGDLMSADESGIRLRITSVEDSSGSVSPVQRSVMSVPGSSITAVTIKQFSATKTAVVAVGLVGGLILAIKASGIGGSGNSKDPDKPVPPPGVQ